MYPIVADAAPRAKRRRVQFAADAAAVQEDDHHAADAINQVIDQAIDVVVQAGCMISSQKLSMTRKLRNWNSLVIH